MMLNSKTNKNFVLWITGLSGSGKTTLANSFVKRYKNRLPNMIMLDGDELRDIIVDRDQERQSYERNERIKIALRYSFLCRLLHSQGISVVISTISMFEEVYKWNRRNINNYVEIFLDIPLEEIRSRDPKGIYKKYHNKEIKNVAGLDLQVDRPKNPDLRVSLGSQKNSKNLEEKIYNLLLKG